MWNAANSTITASWFYTMKPLTTCGKCRRYRNRQTSLEDISPAQWDKLSTLDEYPSDSFVFSAFGYDLHIRDEPVAGAFASLPKQERQILILHCVAAMADSEIGCLVGMSKSAVQRQLSQVINHLLRFRTNGSNKIEVLVIVH